MCKYLQTSTSGNQAKRLYLVTNIPKEINNYNSDPIFSNVEVPLQHDRHNYKCWSDSDILWLRTQYL